jgi:hypothetical protein
MEEKKPTAYRVYVEIVGPLVRQLLQQYLIPDVAQIVYRYFFEPPLHVCDQEKCFAVDREVRSPRTAVFRVEQDASPWTVAFVRADLSKNLRGMDRSAAHLFLMNRHKEFSVSPVCASCKRDPVTVGCASCRSVAYCDDRCRIEHWGVHVQTCSLLKQKQKARRPEDDFVFRYVRSWVKSDPLGCMSYYSPVLNTVVHRLVHKHDRGCRIGFSFFEDGHEPSETLLALFLTTPDIERREMYKK